MNTKTIVRSIAFKEYETLDGYNFMINAKDNDLYSNLDFIEYFSKKVFNFDGRLFCIQIFQLNFYLNFMKIYL